ncbi:interleukin-36 gamma-like [Choloepus didactylus]|uniref:interleukin-36 gamma-like n=1 Tax=Choloepus didactylus TaxID=27675 RepID=UPI00189DED9D|nr:interleukin-36 gamma-like [Choloepus didactylus]
MGCRSSPAMKDTPDLNRHRQHSDLAVADQPNFGEISDQNQQVWALQGKTLVAIPRSDNKAAATVVILPCKYPQSLEQGKGVPIYLGIESPEMCLCCEDAGGQHLLQLKEQKIMDLYHRAEPVKPFLFYHSRPGRASTFESVAFPGWFIASSERDQPLLLTSELGTKFNTAFDLEIKA